MFLVAAELTSMAPNLWGLSAMSLSLPYFLTHLRPVATIIGIMKGSYFVMTPRVDSLLDCRGKIKLLLNQKPGFQ